LVLAVVISFATAVGNLASSYVLFGTKVKEEAAKATVERRARGAQLHCEKLQQAASLAAEIDFRASRGDANAMSLGKLLRGIKPGKPSDTAWMETEKEQRAFEKRAFELMPFLEKSEAALMEEITLHHDVLMNLKQWGGEQPGNVKVAAFASGDDKERRSTRGTPGESPSFNAHQGLAVLRTNAAELAQIYRLKCTEDDSAAR
jgi:hypothetical protein